MIHIVILSNYVWAHAGVQICKCIGQCACFNTECTLFSMAIGQNKGVDSFYAVKPHLDLQYGKIWFFFLLYISMKSTINMSAVPQCVYFRDIVTVSTIFVVAHNRFLKKTGFWKKPWFKPKSWKKPVFIGFFQDFGFFTFPADQSVCHHFPTRIDENMRKRHNHSVIESMIDDFSFEKWQPLFDRIFDFLNLKTICSKKKTAHEYLDFNDQVWNEENKQFLNYCLFL